MMMIVLKKELTFFWFGNEKVNLVIKIEEFGNKPLWESSNPDQDKVEG